MSLLLVILVQRIMALRKLHPKVMWPERSLCPKFCKVINFLRGLHLEKLVTIFLTSYKLGKTLGPAYDMLSPFACLSGKDNSQVNKGEIQVIVFSKSPAHHRHDCQSPFVED